MASAETKNEIEDLVDYEEDDEVLEAADKGDAKEVKKGHYTGIHSSGFRDFILKPEIVRAVTDCGFEHPSEVQHVCIPQAVLGMDVVCQAKSGMGKTAVFVLATLHQLEAKAGEVGVVVICHTRELAFQIAKEYQRFSKYLADIKVGVFYGGVPITQNRQLLKTSPPNIVVGTPGRVLALVREGALKLENVKHFVVDEADQVLTQLDMRGDVQQIFVKTPHDKQVMMFSATFPEAMRVVAKKFMQNPMEIYVDDESKLTLHGLQQYFVNVREEEKNRKLANLLDALEFNQVVIFVSKIGRARELGRLLEECCFPTITIHSKMKQEERISRYQAFKNFEKRVLVTTDLFGRGMDIERVNIVINYDFAPDSDQYLHRVGRAGRFGTKGLAISFVTSEDDEKILAQVQSRFDVKVQPLPDKIDVESYMPSSA